VVCLPYKVPRGDLHSGSTVPDMHPVQTAQSSSTNGNISRASRIYHGPFNIAGIPGLIARAERARGYQSSAVCFPGGVYDRDVDRQITAFTADEAARASGGEPERSAPTEICPKRPC
jgi:hypothetical protein